MTMPAKAGSIPVQPRRFYIAIGIRKATSADGYSLKDVLIARKIIADYAQAIMKAKK